MIWCLFGRMELICFIWVFVSEGLNVFMSLVMIWCEVYIFYGLFGGIVLVMGCNIIEFIVIVLCD